MKNKLTRAILTILAMVLAASMLAGCAADPEPVVTDEPAASGTGVPEEQATGEPVVPTDEPTAVPVTGEPKPEVTDGMMLYYEDFSSYENISGAERVAGKLNWDVLSVAENRVSSDWTAEMAIEDGRLVITNYWPEEGRSGSDGYVQILDRNYMKRVWDHGAYTLQYDVTYTAAGNHKRYINIVTELDGPTYNSFHFRIAGYGNNQIHYEDEWLTYDVADTRDLFAAQKNTEGGFTTIAKKLLGIDTSVDNTSAIDNFKDVTVTIRVVRSSTYSAVYMKTADMSDFVQVSISSSESGAYPYINMVKAYGVALKTGGAVNGYVDNIAIWTGTGEMPEDHTVNYVP